MVATLLAHVIVLLVFLYNRNITHTQKKQIYDLWDQCDNVKTGIYCDTFVLKIYKMKCTYPWERLTPIKG